jgi:hypothetical protein
MRRKIHIYIIVIPLIFVNTSILSLAADKELKFPLPNLSPLITNEQCRCEAIVGAGLYGSTIQNKGILGQLSKGTDKISIRIEGNILHFLSGASFEIGEAKAAQFKIISGSDEEVTAILPQETALGYTVDIFTLNKKTGLAVWTKTRSYDAWSGGAPSAQSFYLRCK